ncbi:MAG: hypothetical protein ACPGFB_13410, partial [Verrucomicrobiales bacterium]
MKKRSKNPISKTFNSLLLCKTLFLNSKSVVLDAGVDGDLTGTIVSIAFDDATEDTVDLAIDTTGFSMTGSSKAFGKGIISKLVVTDTGTANPSYITLSDISQQLTEGLSIDSNISRAEITGSIETGGGEVSIDASSITLSSNISSGFGSQSYGGAITLGDSVQLSSSSANFGSTIDGAHNLSANISNDATFNGTIGGSIPLDSITLSSDYISVNANVTTTGSQTYSGAVDLAGDSTLSGTTA